MSTRWCATRRLEIGPLKNLPVIRDLVTDMREFFDKWARAKGQFSGTRTRHDDFAPVKPALGPSASGRCGDRMHRLRRVLQRRATSSPGIPTISARRR